jgi:hypothetical protein
MNVGKVGTGFSMSLDGFIADPEGYVGGKEGNWLLPRQLKLPDGTYIEFEQLKRGEQTHADVWMTPYSTTSTASGSSTPETVDRATRRRDYGRLLYEESPEKSLAGVQITPLRKVAINVPAV